MRGNVPLSVTRMKGLTLINYIQITGKLFKEREVFFGQYHQTVSKHPIEIPANFRGALDGRVVVTQGFDRNLLAMPVENFESLAKLVSALSITDPLARGLMRMLLGNATFCDITRGGGIHVPGVLKSFAGLDSEIVWVGQGKYLELWSGELWSQQQQDLQNADANATRFVSMNLTGL